MISNLIVTILLAVSPTCDAHREPTLPCSQGDHVLVGSWANHREI